MKKMEEMMKKSNLFLAVIFLVMAVISFSLVKNCNRPRFNGIESDTIIKTKTDTLWKNTTIIEKEFVPKYITKIKTDTLFKENGDTVQLITESKRFDKSIVSDKDTADIQIYTSGIKTSLDSLKMRFKTHREVITNTVEITKYVEKKKTFWDRFHIQPQVTGGYDIINKQWGITAGIGIGIDI